MGKSGGSWNKTLPWCQRQLAEQRERQIRLRAEAVAAYGGVCVCCGEREPTFLTIDHIGGRNAHPLAKFRGEAEYRRLRALGWPAGVRVLCMNCNWATRRGQQCPHAHNL